MKKSAKLISLLLVLTLLLGIIPMAVAADTTGAEYQIVNAKYEDTTITKGTAPAGAEEGLTISAGTARKDLNETGLYKRIPRLLIGNKSYLAIEYIVTEDAVTLSNPDIIGDLEFSIRPGIVDKLPGTYPSIEFDYKALKTGSTKVSLKFYYRYDPRSGDTSWHYDIVTFTVVVSANEVQKPSKPTGANFVEQGVAVYMYCKDMDETDGSHDAWVGSVKKISGGCLFGEILDNDSSVQSKGTYPWVCAMTVYANKYLEVYNNNYAQKRGAHRLADGEPETQTVLFYYNAAEREWQFDSEPPIYIDITHTASTPSVTEYTVTYTDGVNGAAFADQTYTVAEGEATPAFDGTPAREGYVFLGWDPEVAETVTGNATYTAKWEQALTEVKVTSSIGEGALLFLGRDFKVTATANTDANLTFAFEDNPAFKQISSSSTSNSKTVWYRVVKITGNYTKINVSVTGTKGTQPAVTGSLSFGVNLRNRIHVSIKTTSGEVIDDVTNIKLNHKYPKWNACPALKYDAAKGEYVMKNAWDLGNQEFVSVSFEHDGETYTTNVTKDGESLFDAIRKGEKEIYVEYVIVNPIVVTTMIDDEVIAQQTFKGTENAELDYSELYSNLLDVIKERKLTPSIQILVDGKPGNKAVFGTNENVVIFAYTKGTITASGDDFVWDNGEGTTSKITATGDDFVWGN